MKAFFIMSALCFVACADTVLTQEPTPPQQACLETGAACNVGSLYGKSEFCPVMFVPTAQCIKILSVGTVNEYCCVEENKSAGVGGSTSSTGGNGGNSSVDAGVNAGGAGGNVSGAGGNIGGNNQGGAMNGGAGGMGGSNNVGGLGGTGVQ